MTIRRNSGISVARCLAGLGLAACILFAAAAGAQPPEDGDRPPDSLNVDVSDCLDLETREQQIACYLARVDEAVDAREAGTEENREPDSNPRAGAASPVVDADRDVPAESGRPVPAESGRPAPPEPREAPVPPQPQPQRDAPAAAREEPREPDDDEIVATITSLREVEPDAYTIYLDNGQVWRQNRPKRYLLREGAEVRLSPTRWGPSYRLTDPDVGSFIQVERLR